MSTKTVNINDLSRAAVTYNNVLRELPYFKFQEVASNLKISVLEVDGEDVLISKRRNADFLRPYIAGLPLENRKELLKFFEAKLKPEITYAEVVDNITNYRDKKVISNAGEPVNNKTKRHPLELLILKDLVISTTEDVIFNIFHGVRDTQVASAATSFNGFYHKINLLEAAGEIAYEKGNLAPTGAFVASGENEFTNYTNMVKFLSKAHPLLRRGELLLYVPEGVMKLVREDFRKLVKAFDYPTMEQVQDKLRGDALIPGLKIIMDESVGSGSKLILTKPGNLDFGVMTESDKQYVQVRNPFKDPNEVQFWIQAGYDTRINDIHQKLFMTNEQSNASVNYAGDTIVINNANPIAVTFTAVQEGGATGTTASTGIKLTFNKEVVGLRTDHIQITDGTGSAKVAGVSGSGKNWVVALSDVSQGDVTLLIENLGGYATTATPTTVAVFSA